MKCVFIEIDMVENHFLVLSRPTLSESGIVSIVKSIIIMAHLIFSRHEDVKKTLSGRNHLTIRFLTSPLRYLAVCDGVVHSCNSPLCVHIMNCSNAFLFSNAVVVGLPRSSRAPMEHLTSIKDSSLPDFAFCNASSSLSNVSTDTAFG